MTDEIVYKTVPLPVSSSHGIRFRESAEEHEARVQAHMDRVHPMLDAIEREEARVHLETGDPVERALCNNRKWKRRTRARERSATRLAEKKEIES